MISSRNNEIQLFIRNVFTDIVELVKEQALFYYLDTMRKYDRLMGEEGMMMFIIGHGRVANVPRKFSGL